MKLRANAILAVAALICLIPAAALALSPYSQDFEAMNIADGGALSADGWLVFANVFSSGGAYLYGYGPFPAPNGGPGFCGLATGEGGAAQGAQQLNVYSDYNNGDHAAGNLIEANTFQEQTVVAGDVGSTWTFEFDAKLANLEGATTALAFIKTLDPSAGWAMTNFLTVDMTTTPATWNTYVLQIVIDPGLVGQIFQFGFSNTASNYEGSGVFYDNVDFYTGTVANEDMSWSGVKSLYR